MVLPRKHPLLLYRKRDGRVSKAFAFGGCKVMIDFPRFKVPVLRKKAMLVLTGFCRMRSIWHRLAAILFFMLLPLHVTAEYQIRISNTNLSVDPALPEYIWNILLIGTDVWEDIPDEGRSDAMVVFSYNTKTGEARLVSLARDLLVNIPASGKNRLNAAHSLGGPNLLMKTINESFGLNITKYASLNIHGIKRIIEAVGGVQLQITEREAESINRMISIEFPEEENPVCPHGDCVLTGLQAMTYARIRDLDNDFGRIQRQQTVLKALADRVSALPEDDRQLFVEKALLQVSTNMSITDILMIGTKVIEHGVYGLKMYRLPQRGTYIFDSYNGMSILLAESKRLREDMNTMLYAE